MRILAMIASSAVSLLPLVTSLLINYVLWVTRHLVMLLRQTITSSRLWLLHLFCLLTLEANRIETSFALLVMHIRIGKLELFTTTMLTRNTQLSDLLLKEDVWSNLRFAASTYWTLGKLLTAIFADHSSATIATIWLQVNVVADYALILSHIIAFLSLFILVFL